MDTKNYFTDGTSIFKLDRFARIAILKNYETGEIVGAKVDGDKIDGFVPVQLPMPPGASTRNKKDKSGVTEILTDPGHSASGEQIPTAGNESARTRRGPKNKTSKYYGVSLHKKSGKWRVQIPTGKGKSIWGGLFDSEEEAAKKVDEMLGKMNLKKKNFPESKP